MKDILSAHPDVAGVFSCNDPMAVGAAQAIADSGKSGAKDIFVVGFNADEIALKAIKAGQMAATVQQVPYEMGKMTVDLALQLLKPARSYRTATTTTARSTSRSTSSLEQRRHPDQVAAAHWFEGRPIGPALEPQGPREIAGGGAPEPRPGSPRRSRRRSLLNPASCRRRLA